MSEGLSSAGGRVLAAIVRYQTAHGGAVPTLRWVAAEAGLTFLSHGWVLRTYNWLSAKGFIERHSRYIRVTPAGYRALGIENWSCPCCGATRNASEEPA